MAKDNDRYSLYDLRVQVVRRPGIEFVCGHVEGATFEVIGEDLVFDGPARVSLYALASVLPLLPARQRAQGNDWLAADVDIACPDPDCGAVFRVTRTGERSFSRSEAIGRSEGTGG